jgi:hypothetical protein
LADCTTDEQTLSLQTCTSYDVATATSLQSKVGVVKTPEAPFTGLVRVGTPGNGQGGVVVKLHVLLHALELQELFALARQ